MFRFVTRLFEIWGKLQTLPPSKISDILRVGGRTVISGVPNGERDRFRPSAWVFTRPRHINASRRRLRLRLGEVTNVPQFRPLDIGPIGYTGQSQDSNFLPPNISLAQFRVMKRLIWRFVQYLGAEALTFSVLLN